MCIEFLWLDGDKELVPLPNSLLFSCIRQQGKLQEALLLCFIFIFLFYLYISGRKFEESGNFLISYLLP